MALDCCNRSDLRPVSSSQRLLQPAVAACARRLREGGGGGGGGRQKVGKGGESVLTAPTEQLCNSIYRQAECGMSHNEGGHGARYFWDIKTHESSM